MIMKNTIKLFVVAGALFGLSSCATTPPLKTNVVANKNNTFTMMAISNSEPNALNGGIAAATEYCKNKNQTAVVLNNSTKYTSNVDQNTKSTYNTVANAVNLNSPTAISKSGSQQLNDNTTVSGSVGLKPFLPTMSTDEDYTSTINFKCN